MKKIILFVFIFLVIILSILITAFGKEPSFEERREKVLSELNLALEKAAEEGRYKCCIEPACTMCYLGHWIWKDGSCYCDDMISKEEMDKVCPQCVRGIEEGQCKSAEEFCDITNGENFKSV